MIFESDGLGESVSGIYGIPETFRDSAPENSTPEKHPGTPRNRRPTQAVIEERDDRVLSYVREHAGVSRTEIARELGLTPHQTYLSLNRLGTGNVYTRRVNNAYLWYPADGRT